MKRLCCLFIVVLSYGNLFSAQIKKPRKTFLVREKPFKTSDFMILFDPSQPTPPFTPGALKRKKEEKSFEKFLIHAMNYEGLSYKKAVIPHFLIHGQISQKETTAPLNWLHIYDPASLSVETITKCILRFGPGALVIPHPMNLKDFLNHIDKNLENCGRKDLIGSISVIYLNSKRLDGYVSSFSCF